MPTHIKSVDHKQDKSVDYKQDKSVDYNKVIKFYNNDFGSCRVNIDIEKCMCMNGNICGYCIDLYIDYVKNTKKTKKQCQIL